MVSNSYSLNIQGTREPGPAVISSGYGGYYGVLGGSATSVSLWTKVDRVNIEGVAYLVGFGTIDSSGSNTNEFSLLHYVLTTGIAVSLGGDNFALFSGSPWNDGSWHNLVATCPGSGNAYDLKLYLDGAGLTPITVSTGTGVVQKNTISGSHFRVGNNPAGIYEFDGLIDEVALWNVALTASAVATIYNAGAATLDLNTNQGLYTSSANLQLWWRFESPGNDQVINSGTLGNTRNGFIVGGALLSADYSTDVPV